ncbi:leishmanolysin family protein, putative [Ichthyophthirius multifiliis]|uniref:Leishmanolysin family protein, putative n=1 Tax=Ichthyophthirius multifiliis TaxID=5932 RepID=G0QKY4_ICHMU|nr:leishmanolysin family protein, putative [Ichthyophthirius multifiliis]EGR34135.1 leishmanolysin family protein, putative [Ichthyophthirius multifiliis]|eukprot:XP_004039439.1 leishmanolysin family protein, putative [Ichthyophthirius multifiliis]
MIRIKLALVRLKYIIFKYYFIYQACNTDLNKPYCLLCEMDTTYTPICKSCIVGYYLDSNQICQQCNTQCKDCNQQPNRCISCYFPFFLNVKTSTCDLQCQVGSYLDLNRICQGYFFIFQIKNNFKKECNSNCVTCSITSTNCISCKINEVLEVSSSPYYKCQSTCNDTIRSFIDDNFYCRQCSDNCYKCEKFNDNCTACWNDYFIIQNGEKASCVKQCGFGFYNDPTGKCLKCNASCQTCEFCSSSTACLRNQKCFVCSDGYFFVQANNSCQPCTFPCKNCISQSTQCKDCYEKMFFNQEKNICQFECDTNNGYYIQDLGNKSISCQSKYDKKNKNIIKKNRMSLKLQYMFLRSNYQKQY